MLRRSRLEAEDLQGLRARGRRLPPLPGRQRHDRRALHVGLGRRRAQAGSLIRPVRDEVNFAMATSPIYLTEADVGRLVTVKDAIATLEALFATWGQPSTSNLPRQRARLAGVAFNLIGAAYGAKGVHGLKAYNGVKGGQIHTRLYSSLDGRLMAMIEADLFGQMRMSMSSRARPSSGRPLRGRWRKSSAWRCCLHARPRPALPRPTWWSPSPTLPSRFAGRNGSPQARTSTSPAPMPAAVARWMRKRCCAPPSRQPITSSRRKSKPASFASSLPQASSHGRRSANSASSSRARPAVAARPPA